MNSFLRDMVNFTFIGTLDSEIKEADISYISRISQKKSLPSSLSHGIHRLTYDKCRLFDIQKATASLKRPIHTE